MRKRDGILRSATTDYWRCIYGTLAREGGRMLHSMMPTTDYWRCSHGIPVREGDGMLHSAA